MTAGLRWRAAARHLATAALVLAALPASASAHAVLQHTTPHQNSSVTAAPERVQLDFNEPVEVSFGSVRVYDERGQRVDAGEVAHPQGRPESVVVGLREGLGRGIYTTTYRVVSADGHPVSGGYAFGVGEQGAAERDTPQVAELLARSSAGPAVEGIYGVVRGLHYAALLLLVGAVFFRLLVARDAWPLGLLMGGAAVGLVTAAAGIVLQGLLGSGLSLGHAFDGPVLDGSLDTRTGEAWLIRVALWAGVIVALALATRRAALAVAVPIAGLVATLPYAGHAETQSPRAALIPADVLHVLAAGAWLGGLVLLLVRFWPRGGESADGAEAATARFSRMALPAIVLLVGAGTVQAWFYLDGIGGFVDGTYGPALLAKIALLAGIVAVAAGNRRRVARLTDMAVASRLRTAMRAEVGLAVLVLAGTAVVVRAAPPASLNSGPVIRELDLGPMRLQMDIEPADVGPNDYHLYLFDRRTGAQIDRVEELTVTLVERDKGIGPIEIEIPRKGPAHYELRNSNFGVAGTWEATVAARVSEFDLYSAKTTFRIRG
jgi:copper transport protein